MILESILLDFLETFMNILPKVFGALLVLIIGWIAGRIIGKGLSKVLDRFGVDEALYNTAIGKVLERSGVTTVRFFDLVVRWFIYLIAVFAAVDILDIAVLSEFMKIVVEYLPSFIGGVFIFIFGFIVVDFIGDTVASVGREAKIEFSGLFAVGLKLLLYFIVSIIALNLMRIDVEILYIFAKALAWGVAIGAAAGLGIALGWGFKDVVAKKAEKWISSTQKGVERVEEFWDWYTRKNED